MPAGSHIHHHPTQSATSVPVRAVHIDSRLQTCCRDAAASSCCRPAKPRHTRVLTGLLAVGPKNPPPPKCCVQASSQSFPARQHVHMPQPDCQTPVQTACHGLANLPVLHVLRSRPKFAQPRLQRTSGSPIKGPRTIQRALTHGKDQNHAQTQPKAHSPAQPTYEHRVCRHGCQHTTRQHSGPPSPRGTAVAAHAGCLLLLNALRLLSKAAKFNMMRAAPGGATHCRTAFWSTLSCVASQASAQKAGRRDGVVVVEAGQRHAPRLRPARTATAACRQATHERWDVLR